MSKTSSVAPPPVTPASSAKQYLRRWRGWAAALALLWLLSLLVITSPDGSNRGDTDRHGFFSAHARAVPKRATANTSNTGTELLVASEQSAYNDAIKSFRDGRYAAAFGRFTALADAGHKASAESALFMLRHGQELFGVAWSASADEQLLWQALVVRDASRVMDNPAGD